MSLIVASEESTPFTAPMDTLIPGEDNAREIKLARTPLSSSVACALAQRAKKAINANALRRMKSCVIRMTARC